MSASYSIFSSTQLSLECLVPTLSSSSVCSDIKTLSIENYDDRAFCQLSRFQWSRAWVHKNEKS